MKNEQILLKAIEKAVKGGMSKVCADDLKDYRNLDYYKIIFSHEFAKPFWGEYDNEEKELCKKIGIQKDSWEYHLQQMVLEKEPLKYIKLFLDE